MTKCIACLPLCLALAACGGGVGGVAPIITSDNYLGVAQQSLSATRYLGVVTDFSVAVPTLAGVLTQTLNCSAAGTVHVAVNDANGNLKADAGDSFTLSMNNCQEGSTTLNGSLALTINSATGDVVSQVYAQGVSLTLDQLRASSGSSASAGSGSLGLSTVARGPNDQTRSLTVPSLALASTFANVTQSVTLSNLLLVEVRSPTPTGFDTTTQANGSFASSGINNHALALVTTVPFVQASAQSYPHSGQIVVSDDSHRKIRLTAIDATTVRIEVDAGANGSYDLSVTRRWSELD